MIIDFHTHIFPPSVIEDRAAYVARDATFRELYRSLKAKLATADDLLRSMDNGGIDVAVALGFAWTDADTCRRHNDYLMEAAARSSGRIVPFCTLPLAAGEEAVVAEAERCGSAGVRGFGELRPESVGADLDRDGLAGALVQAAGGERILHFHVSEPAGHDYPGKGGLAVASFYRFVQAHPDVRVVGAHWGGGLPLYALMPEVKLALRNACFDTAGTSLLYVKGVYRRMAEVIGSEKIAFGSDFPLLSQARSRRRIEAAGLDSGDLELILGGTARRLLGLE